MVDDLVVISKNRAMQLHLLLESNKRNCDFFRNISVLYLCTDPRFETAYELLKSRFPEVKFIKETNFQDNVKDAFRSAGELVAIVSDDCIFCNDIKSRRDEVINCLRREEVFTFILGLGINCVVDVLHRPFQQPKFQNDNGILLWQWSIPTGGATTEFGCPFMLACNIYKKKDYLPCVESVSFESPSPFEAALQYTYQQAGSPISDRLCACLPLQGLLHSTNNRVSTYGNMPHGERFFYSDIGLNNEYLEGKVVNYDEINFDGVNSLHVELALPLKEYNG